MNSNPRLGETSHMNLPDVLDAAFAIGHRLRIQSTPGTLMPTTTWRIEWVRGQNSSQVIEATIDRAIERHEEALNEFLNRLLRQLLGDDMVRHIHLAMTELANAQGQSTCELRGGHADGTRIVIPADSKGWPPPIWVTPAPMDLLPWTSDTAPSGPLGHVTYHRGLLDPETSVWTYSPDLPVGGVL